MYMLYKGKEGVPFASSDIWFKEKVDESDRFIGPGYYESRTFIEEKIKPSSNTASFNTKDSWF